MAPLALLVALLAGGGAFGAYLLLGEDGGHRAGTTAGRAPREAAAPSPAADEARTSHRVTALRAVLTLPASYRRTGTAGSAAEQPRTATFDNDVVRVRLTQWDKAPAAPMTQAKRPVDGFPADEKVSARYTRTSFEGDEAVLADATFPARSEPVRVLRLLVRTDDGRLYELRVDMPKGTAREEDGTAVFKECRERLRILPA